MIEARRIALRQGRDARLAEIRGEPVPPCPYRPNTQRHRWWHDGAEFTGRLVQRIMEIGA